MAKKKKRALLPASSYTVKENPEKKWHRFDDAQPYIQGMETGEIADQIDAKILNALVSGVPTVWARARLFGFAFPYTQVEANIKTSALIKFYETLIDEWKGLISILALFPDRITVSEPIPMNPENENDLFYIPDGFGRMLFEDFDLWCHPENLKKQLAEDDKPFTQLIYYRGRLVGAISPYSLVFTACDYTGLDGTGDIPWYRNGKFDDPLRFELTNDQIQKLYLLINNINESFYQFEERVNLNRKQKPAIQFYSFKEFLRKWRDEIKAKGTNISEEGTLDAALDFAEPYKALFNVEQLLYAYPNGRFSMKVPDSDSQISEIDPQELLLEEEYIIEIPDNDDEQPLEKSAVYFLRVPNPEPEKSDKELFFPLPLSKKGLMLFKNKISDLLTQSENDKHHLSGFIRPDDYKLVVELHLIVDGKRFTPITREYELQPIENNRKVIMWPNFISAHWTQYYLYSGFPSTDTATQMIPFFKNPANPEKNQHEEEIVIHKNEILYADSEDFGDTGLQIDKLIVYPAGMVDSSKPKYEIFRSNRPVAGIEIRKIINGKDRILGYLMVKKPKDDSMGDKKIDDFTQEANLADVVVGIDFGSNNSCVHFAMKKDGDVHPVPFKNRRIFLVGTETIDPDKSKIAEYDELFFFQNEKIVKGQIKSWVHEHNPHYINKGMKKEELAGGVSIFKPNIHIKEMDEKTITTNAGTLHHSMKWLTDLKGKDMKIAYLKTIWLQMYADLYALQLKPTELKWSYPGAFSQSEVTQYGLVFDEIGDINPVDNAGKVKVSEEPLTEAEAVSNYSTTVGVSLQDNNMFLGIDIGGSTSDILIITQDLAGDKEYKLVKQSSIRLAAGFLSKAIQHSESFQKVILDYHNDPNSRLNIPNMEKTMSSKPNTAPFYLNAIFDRLRGDYFEKFYRFIAQRTPHIFALPAYINGLLMFYSGKLIAKAIKENPTIEKIDEVNLLPFGKGGRIFDWLDTFPNKKMAQDFYANCFRSGFGETFEKTRGYKLISAKLNAMKNNGVSENTIQKIKEYVDLLYPSKEQLVDTLVQAAGTDNVDFGAYLSEEKTTIKPENIRLKKIDRIREDNKSEVAIGLTAPQIVSVEKNIRTNSDIFGENGFTYREVGKPEKRIDENAVIQKDHFINGLGNLKIPREFEEFHKFLVIYFDFIKNTGILSNVGDLKRKEAELYSTLKSYVINDNEYKKARLTEDFDYKHSMLILEGMCFMEEFLIPEVYRK